MAKLYSYKMSHDDKFAPNPFYGVLTLATCMNKLRYNTKVGNWVAGWTSRKTATSTPVGEERLIYLARVTDKIPIADYWDKYPQKRPSNADETARHGDNIYKPDSSAQNGLKLVNSDYRKPTDTEKIRKDLNGQYVLVCNEFYYFGADNPLLIPPTISSSRPRAQSAYGVITKDATDLIDFVKAHAEQCQEFRF